MLLLLLLLRLTLLFIVVADEMGRTSTIPAGFGAVDNAAGRGAGQCFAARFHQRIQRPRLVLMAAAAAP